MTRRENDLRAERMARGFPEQKGYRTLTTNYHCRYGEIGIIAEDGATLVFVDVRSKQGGGYGGAGEPITAAKRRKLRLTVDRYLSQLTRYPEDCAWTWCW